MGAIDRSSEREATFNYCLDMLGQIAELLQRQACEPEMAALVRAISKSQQSSFAMANAASIARTEDELRSFAA